MELTWVTIAASLALGLSALFLFVYAVKRGWLKDIEEAKYQVFWTDQEQGNPASKKEGSDGGQPQTK